MLSRWKRSSTSTTEAAGQSTQGLTHCAGRVPAAVERGVRALPPAGSGLPREESEQEEESAGNGHG
jgi:hypothetical protein